MKRMNDINIVGTSKKGLKGRTIKVIANVLVRAADNGLNRCLIFPFYEPTYPVEIIKDNAK